MLTNMYTCIDLIIPLLTIYPKLMTSVDLYICESYYDFLLKNKS